MIEHKTWPSTNVSDIARLLSDDSACPHRVWFSSRYGTHRRAVGHKRGPADENSGHTLVVDETADRLEQRGDDVFPQFRNGFEATGSVSGTRIAGRPEIVVRHADGGVAVYVARTGEPEAVDEACRRPAIMSSVTVQRKCPHEGECDIDAARAGKASGTK